MIHMRPALSSALCWALLVACSASPPGDWVPYSDPYLGLAFELPADFVPLTPERSDQIVDLFRAAGAPQATVEFLARSLEPTDGPDRPTAMVALSSDPYDWLHPDSVSIAVSGSSPPTPSAPPPAVLEAIRVSLADRGATRVMAKAAEASGGPALVVQYQEASQRIDGTTDFVLVTLVTFSIASRQITVSLTTPLLDAREAEAVVMEIANSVS